MIDALILGEDGIKKNVNTQNRDSMMYRIKTVFILCVICSFSFAEKADTSQSFGDAKKLFDDGLFWMKKERYIKARIKFSEVLKIQPELAEAHNNYAYCTRKVSPENYAESLKHYNKALELNPKLAVAYQYRGCLHVLMGNTDLAKKDYKTLLKLDHNLAKPLRKFINNKGKETEQKSYLYGY